MSFFDSKQEVLDIQLTPHGKEMLMKGLLKPQYYSFHDDDIIYNSEFAGNEETNDQTHVRILDETGYLKLNARRKSVGSAIRTKGASELYEKDVYELSSLGASSFGNSNAPSWGVQMLESEIREAKKTYTHQTLGELPIPQINIRPVFFKVSVVPEEELPPGEYNIVFQDGRGITLDKTSIILDLDEYAVDSKDTNFDIELYEMIDTDGEEKLKQINFKKESSNIRNNILLDEVQQANEFDDLDTAEKYFLISVDDHVLLASAVQEDISVDSRGMKKEPFGDNC